MSVAEKVRRALKAKRPGSVIRAQSLEHLGSREAIDQVLSRLAKQHGLIRISRGIYVLPVSGKFGAYPPPSEAVVRSFARAKKQAIVPNGAVAANRFGLTTQQPVRKVYLTSGRAHRLALGANEVEVRKAPKWQTLYPNRPAGEAIRALAFVGKSGVNEAAARIKGQLPSEEWAVLAKARSKLPAWMAEAVSKVELVA